jgi:hypothetical protein
MACDPRVRKCTSSNVSSRISSSIVYGIGTRKIVHVYFIVSGLLTDDYREFGCD